jgi:peptidyl-tRNA hydrolase
MLSLVIDDGAYMERDLAVYVMVRNDLPSLTPGKAAAQVHHSGVQMMVKHPTHKLVRQYIEDGVAQGADQFNTTLTVSANLRQIETAISRAKSMDVLCDILIDPTYPFFVDPEVATLLEANPSVTRVGPVGNSGQELFLRSELTVAWMLGDRKDSLFKSIFESMPLY